MQIKEYEYVVTLILFSTFLNSATFHHIMYPNVMTGDQNRCILYHRIICICNYLSLC